MTSPVCKISLNDVLSVLFEDGMEEKINFDDDDNKI